MRPASGDGGLTQLAAFLLLCFRRIRRGRGLIILLVPVIGNQSKKRPCRFWHRSRRCHCDNIFQSVNLLIRSAHARATSGLDSVLPGIVAQPAFSTKDF